MKTTFKVDSFFRKMKRLGLAVTYNDVRLKTGYSDTDPKAASISTQFSRNVPLNCPLVSAAMDTITEAPMAIAMAMLGGLGIIHKALTPENQVRQVRKVRLHLNCRIDKPICVLGHETIAEILNRRDDKGYSFHSFPVLDNAGKIVGLLTRNDFDLCDGGKVTAAEAMTPLKELVTAKPGTSAEKAHAIMKSAHKKILPLVTGTGKLVGMYVFSDLRRLVSGQYPLYNIDAEGHLRVGAAIDVGQEELERAEMLMAAGCDVLVIDKAHGDQRPVREMMINLKRLKCKHPGCDIVVGNISEPESAVRLAKWGADGIKVGQGGGSICTTRIKTGIGCPQVTAAIGFTGMIMDTDALMRESLGRKNILFEGAQGHFLSVRYGTYPYVTSSDCSAQGLAQGVGLRERDIDIILAIVKAFCMTRVGEGPFPTEMGAERSAKWCGGEAEKVAKAEGFASVQEMEEAKFSSIAWDDPDEFRLGIRSRITGKEFGATTHRPRRPGWLDLPLLRCFREVTGNRDVILTKLDVMSQCPVIKICVAYEYTGPVYRIGRLTIDPGSCLNTAIPRADVLEHCYPIYQQFPGWLSDISQARTVKDLPTKLMNIIEFIEDKAVVNARILSVGSDRKQIIFVE